MSLEALELQISVYRMPTPWNLARWLGGSESRVATTGRNRGAPVQEAPEPSTRQLPCRVECDKGRLLNVQRRVHIGHESLKAMAKCVNGAPCRKLLGGVDNEFAVEYDIGHMKTDDYRGTLCATRIPDDGTYRPFRARSSVAWNVDHKETLSSDDRELLQVVPHGPRWVPRARCDHLSGVEYGSTSDRHDAVGVAIDGRTSALLYGLDGWLGVDVVEHGERNRAFTKRGKYLVVKAKGRERLVGYHQHALASGIDADLPDLLPCPKPCITLGVGSGTALITFPGTLLIAFLPR